MKRLTLAVLAAAVCCRDRDRLDPAPRRAPGPAAAASRRGEEFEYLPSVNSMFDGQSGGAFTIPPA